MKPINFLTLTNSGYEFFCDSQIENFKCNHLKNHSLTIYCADSNSYERLSNKNLPDNISIRKIDQAEIGGLHAYLVGRFKELMRLKFPIILDHMKEVGGPVWFIDNDVLFFDDPSSFINTEKDIIFQPDAGDFEDRYSWVCTGCFWINPTEKSIQFLENLIKMQGQIDRGEQEILNDYCKSWTSRSHMDPIYKGSILDFKEADFDIFPYHLFQNGYAAFKHGLYDKEKCIMIHFNHEQDFNAKVANFNKVKEHYKI
jgi:hypothetical protein